MAQTLSGGWTTSQYYGFMNQMWMSLVNEVELYLIMIQSLAVTLPTVSVAVVQQ